MELKTVTVYATEYKGALRVCFAVHSLAAHLVSISCIQHYNHYKFFLFGALSSIHNVRETHPL